MDFWKVWWHCLAKFYMNFKGEIHCQCYYQVTGEKKVHFCSCGYNHPKGYTWKQHIKNTGV